MWLIWFTMLSHAVQYMCESVCKRVCEGLPVLSELSDSHLGMLVQKALRTFGSVVKHQGISEPSGFLQ